MSAEDPLEGSGFTYQEMRVIFERAGISEATRDDSRRYTLAEIEAIGAEAGIDPGDIRRAAATVREVSVTHRLLGAPTRFRASHFFDHPIGEDRLADTVDVLRREVGLHGDLRFVPGGVEWQARPALGAIIVVFSPRRNGTRVTVLVAREDAAVLAVLVGCGIGFVAGLAAGIAVLIGSHGNAFLGLGVFATATIAAAYASMRLIWHRASRRAAAITKSLLETIVSLSESVGEDPAR
jgi:hypothetical protein